MWCWYFIRKLKIIVAWNCNCLFCVFLPQSRHLCKILFFFQCIDCGNNKKWSSHSLVIFSNFFLLSVWFYVGMAGAFCFILIQLVLLIDFAHSWNESWVEKMEEGNSRCWYAGKFFCLIEHLQDSWTLKVKAGSRLWGSHDFYGRIYCEEVF